MTRKSDSGASSRIDTRGPRWTPSPPRPRILERLREISRSTSATYSALQYRGGALFALKAQPPAQRPYLVMMAPPDDLRSERVVVDPNALDRSGQTAIDFYVPSLDGRLVAVSLSRNGTEEGTIHVYESATGGRSLDPTIAHVNDATAAGSVAWNAAATGFYYTRYPRDGERPTADRDFLSADLFSPSRDTSRTRCVRNRQRVSAHRLYRSADCRPV